MNPEILARLRTVLAKLYPDELDIRRIIADAGLDIAWINLDSAAINDWQAVLAEAEKVGRLDALLGVVEGEYGSNPEFREGRDACRQAVQQLEQARNSVQEVTDRVHAESADSTPVHRQSAGQIEQVRNNDQEVTGGNRAEPVDSGSSKNPTEHSGGFLNWWNKLGANLQVTIIGALITAFAAVVVAVINLIPTLLEDGATPTAIPDAVPMPILAVTTLTITTAISPTNIVTATASVTSVVTPTITPVPSLTTSVSLPKLSVGIATLANCQNPDLTAQLISQIKKYINAMPVEVTTLPEIEDSVVARTQKQAIVIWGTCESNRLIKYHAEFLLIGDDGNHHRIAQPTSLNLKWRLDEIDVLAKTSAGVIAYYSLQSTHTAAVLLSEVRKTWELVSIYERGPFYLILGNAWLEDNNYDEALQVYQTILEFVKLIPQPSDSRLTSALYSNIGFAYLGQKDADNAIDRFTKAIQLYEQVHKIFDRAYTGRAEAYRRIDKFDLASEDCTTAIKFAIHTAPGYVCLALTDFSSGTFNTLLENSKKAVANNQTYAPAYYTTALGYCLEERNVQKAIENLEKFIKNIPLTPRWEISPLMIDRAAQDLDEMKKSNSCQV